MHHPLHKSSGLLRVNVVGTSGSGKSTFSRRLAERLDAPHIEMDRVFWKPDWQMPTDEEFFSKLERELDQERWILDGNYTRTTSIKWRNVQSVIWLDYSFSRTLAQSVKRAIIRAVTRQEFWPGTGNRETFRKSFFSRESVILWAVKTYHPNRRKYLAMSSDNRFPHIRFLRFRTPRETERWLAEIAE